MNITKKQLHIIKSQIRQYLPTHLKFKGSLLSHYDKPFFHDFNDQALEFLDHFLLTKLNYKFLNQLFQKNPELYKKFKSPKLGQYVFIKIIESDLFKKECQKAQLVNYYVLDKSTNREYPVPMNQHEHVIPLILKTHPELTDEDEKQTFIEQQLEMVSNLSRDEIFWETEDYELPESILKFDQPLHLDKHKSFINYIKIALKQFEAIKKLKEDQCVFTLYENAEGYLASDIYPNLETAMKALSELGQNAINQYINNHASEHGLSFRQNLLRHFKPTKQGQETKGQALILDISPMNDISREQPLLLALKNPIK